MLGKGNKKINKKDQENTTALHYAVRYNHLHIVKLLLDYGAGKEKVECSTNHKFDYMVCVYSVCSHLNLKSWFADKFITDPLEKIYNLDYDLNDPHTFRH